MRDVWAYASWLFMQIAVAFALAAPGAALCYWLYGVFA